MKRTTTILMALAAIFVFFAPTDTKAEEFCSGQVSLDTEAVTVTQATASADPLLGTRVGDWDMKSTDLCAVIVVLSRSGNTADVLYGWGEAHSTYFDVWPGSERVQATIEERILIFTLESGRKIVLELQDDGSFKGKSLKGEYTTEGTFSKKG